MKLRTLLFRNPGKTKSSTSSMPLRPHLFIRLSAKALFNYLCPTAQTMLSKARKLVLIRSEEHASELQSLMRISYAVFCLKKKKNKILSTTHVYTKPDTIQKLLLK